MGGWRTIFCILLLLGTGSGALAQKYDSVFDKSFSQKKAKISPGKAASNLSKTLSSKTANEPETADKYEILAKELTDKGDYLRAEENWKKAIEIYTRLNRKEQAANASRELAKVQETQNKIIPAIASYQSASKTTSDKSLQQANQNDASRLLNTNNPQVQIEYTQSNLRIFEKENKPSEIVGAYKNLGVSQLQLKNTSEAVNSFNKAIAHSGNTSEIADISNKLQQMEITNSDLTLDTTIQLGETILEKARQQHDTDLLINQLQLLARLQARNGHITQARTLQEEAYALALRSGNTLIARNSVMELAHYDKIQYSLNYIPKITIPRYESFLMNLDSLIKKDSSLVDAKLFEVTESRIKDLEKEKKLQLELISKKNTLNYFLIGSVLAMLLLLGFIIRSLYAIRTKNKKIALQSLRREMNPHFIFNSLNSVNQYIAENNELEANRYLTSYSGLMRNVMEHSHKDFVPLSVEIEQLEEYLNLEHLRFNTQFTWQLTVDDTLDTDAFMIPNMLLQPHLENAVWHGLRYKPGMGLLQVHFVKKGKELVVTIEDDGIGLTESQRLKTINQKAHQSRGLNNTRERIQLLNDLYPVHIRLTMEEINGYQVSGTRVTLQMVLLEKT